MSLSADLSAATLTICLELRDPFSYLALGPAAEFGRARGLTINWLPLATPGLRPPSAAGPDDDRGILHRRHRARALAREIETYARAQGLELLEFYRHAPADAAVRGWLWMRDRDPDRLEGYLARLFRAYWALQIDADRDESIAELIDASGGDGAAYRAWSPSDGRAATAALDEELRSAGIFNAPAYLVEDEVFYGRQHLAMIGWILDGRSGPVPI